MNENIISNLTKQSGTNNRYQYISLLIIFLLYGTTEFLAISLPFLESKPLVSFKDNYNVTHVKSINYTICENYTYEIVKNYSSIVNDLEIYCDRTKTSIIGTSLFFGILIGSLFSYVFTDRLGRKNSAFFFSIFYLLTIVLFSFIYNIYIIYGLILLSGFFYIIVALSAIILLNEIISEHLVAMFTTIIYIAYFIFGLGYTYLFYELDNWRVIFRIIACIHLVSCILFYIYIEESPRFYVAKKDYANFIKVIRKIAIKNKLYLLENDINQLIPLDVEDSKYIIKQPGTIKTIKELIR